MHQLIERIPEKVQRVAVYLFLTLLVAAVWLVPDHWLSDYHDAIRVTITLIIGFVAILQFMMDHAVQYPDDMPTNREEEALDKESRKPYERVNLDSPAAEREHQQWLESGGIRSI